MAAPQNALLFPTSLLTAAEAVAAIIDAATKAVVGQLIRRTPPISAMMLGKSVAVMSRFIECRRLPPNSTANGRMEPGARRADQVPGMGAFSSALYGATTLRLCIALPHKLGKCYRLE